MPASRAGAARPRQRRGELPFGWYRRNADFRAGVLGSAATVAHPVAQSAARRNGHGPSAPDAARPAAAGTGAQAEQAETPMPSAMTADERDLQRWLDLVEGRGWRD